MERRALSTWSDEMDDLASRLENLATRLQAVANSVWLMEDGSASAESKRIEELVGELAKCREDLDDRAAEMAEADNVGER